LFILIFVLQYPIFLLWLLVFNLFCYFIIVLFYLYFNYLFYLFTVFHFNLAFKILILLAKMTKSVLHNYYLYIYFFN